MAGEGLELSSGGEITKSRDFDIEWWTETRPRYGPLREVADGGKLRNLFISTKASVAITEADRLRRYLDKSSSVVFAQNGMSKLWPPHGSLYVASRYQAANAPNFLACVVNHGVLSTGPFRSIHAAPADAFIAPVLLNPQPPPSVEFFTKQITTTPRLNTKSVTSGELWLLQLEKLVMNAVINPLSALLRCKNGELFTSEDPDDPLVQVLVKLLGETSAVLQALINHDSSTDILTSYVKQIQPSESDLTNASLSKLKSEVTNKFSHANLKRKLYTFGIKVGENRSSMLQDVEAGKKTEIRDFNGWIVDMAAFLADDLDVSTHLGLIELVEKNVVLNKGELAERLL
ncbi:2-dehydropantoate 2-reductase (Ketopantoate reductase) (KPA reductase) (KPR) [Conoideocrella luteorostrata]|uniref:2-dehydropantoate 2-reductase (Ketopantoate reductase) (KPA reductase) (KPR) n=1 Tax=Conoideocrella luteorostrata TaxID=1105319 RepID=A0AAJ0FX39_9HYPO|nr:2-dehydropantoate 2-reductase (Ketopantoate reductase) (KPA reductase) (KPR) [Conoideocrella luteorostrata]